MVFKKTALTPKWGIYYLQEILDIWLLGKGDIKNSSVTALRKLKRKKKVDIEKRSWKWEISKIYKYADEFIDITWSFLHS